MPLDLYVKKRTLHNATLWWICRKVEDPETRKMRYVFHSDTHAPTGYGYTSRAKAERRARELEQESVTQGQEAP